MSSSFVSYKQKREPIMTSKTERKITYPIALLLSMPSRKTFESLARSLATSGSSVSRMVADYAATTDDLIRIVKKLLKGKRLYLIIDDTLILKLYSKIIPGTCDNYDSSDGKTYRSLCAVVAVITDGNIAIPIDKSIWTSKEFAQDAYAKKWELAQKLIMKIRQKLPIYMLLADGLYAVFEFVEWLISQDIRFEMRFHSNRVIDDKGVKCQIKKSSKFVMSGKRPIRTIRAEWKGVSFYFTALRRVTKTGTVTVIYQVSNYKASARKHTQAYGYRWDIEKFFRTAKQKLGLNDCQSHKLELQENHMLNVFFIYALLQIERKKNNLKNVETAIKQLNRRDLGQIKSRMMRLAENFGVA
jgi:hypothetical protein